MMDTPATTGINWYETVIKPLIDIMLNDGSMAISAVDPLNDPSTIVRYVEIQRQSLSAVASIADKQSQITDH